MAGSRLETRGRKWLLSLARRRRRASLLSIAEVAPRATRAALVLNGIPVAVHDPWYSTPQNTQLVVGSQNHPLLENDWDPEGSTLAASVVANPTSGSLSNFNAATGTFTYTPNTGFVGVDSFW